MALSKTASQKVITGFQDIFHASYIHKEDEKEDGGFASIHIIVDRVTTSQWYQLVI